MIPDTHTLEQVGSLGRKILKAMLVICVFWVFWKFGGFLLNVLVGSFFAASKEADAYFFVYKYVIYLAIYSTALKVLMPVFIPVFTEQMEEKGEEEAWRFVNSVLNLIALGLLAFVVGGLVFAPTIASLAEGFTSETREITARLLRVMLPGVVGLILGILTYALLNSYKVFDYPAAGDAAQKLVWAVVLFVAFKFLGLGVMAIAIGFLAGCGAQIAVNLFGLRSKLHLYRPLIAMPAARRLGRELLWLLLVGGLFAGFAWAVRDTANAKLWILTAGAFLGCGYAVWLWWRAEKSTSVMGKFAALSAPLLIGVLFARYRDFATAYFQSYTQTGVFADLEYARTAGNLPTVLVAYALSVAMFPYLCDLATKRDTATFAELLSRTIRLIALFFVPLTVVMIVLDEPIMRLIFDRGNFPEVHLRYAGTALSVFIFALFFYAVENVVMQSFFSLQQMWWPTGLGIASAIFHALFMYTAIHLLGFNYPYEIFIVVALSFPLSRLFKNVLLLLVMNARVPIFPLRETAIFGAKLAGLCAGVGLVVWGSYLPLHRALPLSPWKEREIVVDTFNREAQGWFTVDAEQLAVVEAEQEEEELLAGSRWALRADYQRSARRQVDLRRDLSAYDWSEATLLILWLKTEPLGQFTLVLEEEDGSRYEVRLPPVGLTWQKYGVPLGELTARGLELSQVRTLYLVDTTPMQEGEVQKATLWLDELSVFDRRGRQFVVDNFEPGYGWTATDPAGPVEVADSDEDPTNETEEPALRMASGMAQVSRTLDGYRLMGMTTFSLKLKADRPQRLEVSLAEADGSVYTARLDLTRSQERKRYTLSLTDFVLAEGSADENGHLDEEQIGRLLLTRRKAQGVLWVDNLVFKRPPPGPHLLIFSLPYEIRKLIVVGGPVLLGFLAFVALSFLLRLEEAALSVAWLRREGWAKIRSLGRRQ